MSCCIADHLQYINEQCVTDGEKVRPEMLRSVKYSSAVADPFEFIARAMEKQAPVYLLHLAALDYAAKTEPLTDGTDLPHSWSMQATDPQATWQKCMQGIPLSSEAVPGVRRSAMRWRPVILLSTRVACASCSTSDCVSRYNLIDNLLTQSNLILPSTTCSNIQEVAETQRGLMSE